MSAIFAPRLDRWHLYTAFYDWWGLFCVVWILGAFFRGGGNWGLRHDSAL